MENDPNNCIQVFLDWRPVPCLPSETGVVYQDFSVERLGQFYSFVARYGFVASSIEREIDGISVAARNDGLFLFSIILRSDGLLAQGDKNANATLLQVSCLLSAYLKTLLGHTHYYDKDILLLSDGEGRGPLQKYPVRLNLSPLANSSTAEGLALVLLDQKEVSRLVAGNWAPFGRYFEENSFQSSRLASEQENPNALVELRAKYSRMFDRAINWAAESKSAKFLGIRIFRMGAFVLFSFVLLNLFLVSHQTYAKENEVASAFGLILFGAAHAALFSALIVTAWRAAFKIVQKNSHWIAPRARKILSASFYAKLHRRFQIILQSPYAFDWGFRLSVVFTMLIPYQNVPDLGVFEPVLGQFLSTLAIPLASQPEFLSSCDSECSGLFLTQLAALTLPASALFYFVSRARQKRVILLYTSLLAHLRYAQILETVIQNIYSASDRSRPAYSDLGTAERIVIEKLWLEKEKRNRLFWSVSIASAAAVLYLLS